MVWVFSILAEATLHKPAATAAARQVALPNEPRIVDPVRQDALTERYLLPALAELEVFFLALRAHVDPELQRLQPIKLGKTYPLGQCLEISKAVQRTLQRLQPAALGLCPSGTAGYAAFTAFRKAGGACRQVWGDLRGEFFQNAFQLGSLYLDVSNDTVTPTKPKVEILPFTEARFTPIADFRHFARIAERYWQHRIYPNHVLPELAPYCPLIHVTASGGVMVCEATHYMVAMTQAGCFDPSESVLGDQVMPDTLFNSVRAALADTRQAMPATPDEGRAMALRACREHRRKRWHVSPHRAELAIRTVQEINRTLGRLAISLAPAGLSQQSPQSMEAGKIMSAPEKIQINGTEYKLSDLSEQARQQLNMVRASDARLAELQRDLAITQTARSAYVAELAKLLPSPPK
ncbi:MAG TPA: hypothetical protein VFT05_03355 [Burkholderiaceae bacterium]|nr:hypothetical protein [Burkholderiaceae bacterium]